jgi:hypothetical protein
MEVLVDEGVQVSYVLVRDLDHFIVQEHDASVPDLELKLGVAGAGKVGGGMLQGGEDQIPIPIAMQKGSTVGVHGEVDGKPRLGFDARWKHQGNQREGQDAKGSHNLTTDLQR